MSSNKKFIPLSECYNKVLKGEKLEPIRESKKELTKKPVTLQQAYRVILQRLDETTDILMQQEPTGDVEEYSVSDDLANRIKKDIKKEVKVKTETGEEKSVSEVVDFVLEEKGWKKKNTDYEKVVFPQVMHAFLKNDIIANNIANYSKLAKQVGSPFSVKIIDAPETVVSYSEIIPDWFNNFFENKNGLISANDLWDISFKIAGIQVGKGELALTMISNAVKGAKGDLFVGDKNIEVEVKGSNARVGGSGYAHNVTSKELNNILNAGPEELFRRTSEKLKAEIVNTIVKKINDRSKIKGTEKEIGYYNKVKQDIENARSFDEITNDLKLLLTADGSKLFTDNIKSFISKIEAYTKHVKKEVKGAFFPAVSTFFSLANTLTDEQLIDGIVACRSYDIPEQVTAIKQAVSRIVAADKDTLFGGELTYNLKCLLAAIHLSCYKHVEHFNNILFSNDSTRRLILFRFNSELIQDNIIQSYNFLKRFKVSFNLSVEEKFKSIGFLFNI